MLKDTALCRRRLESSKLYTLDWKSRSRREIKKEWFITKRWRMMNKTNEIMNRKREKKENSEQTTIFQSPPNATTYYHSECSQAWA
jgi:hypothetical protein